MRTINKAIRMSFSNERYPSLKVFRAEVLGRTLMRRTDEGNDEFGGRIRSHKSS